MNKSIIYIIFLCFLSAIALAVCDCNGTAVMDSTTYIAPSNTNISLVLKSNYAAESNDNINLVLTGIGGIGIVGINVTVNCVMDCSGNCVWAVGMNMNGNNFTFSGPGQLVGFRYITNYNTGIISDGCTVIW